MQDIGDATLRAFGNALSVLLEGVPKIIGFLVILVLGWIISGVLANVVARLLRAVNFNGVATRSGFTGFVRSMGVGTDPAGLLATVAKWFVRLIVLVMAFDALGLPEVSQVLQRLLLWLPNLVVALVVLVVAGLAANALASLVRGATAQAGLGNPDVLASLARVAVMAFAVVIAANQIGIAANLVNTLFTAVVGALALALGLALGLGGRDTAAQIVQNAYQKSRQEEPSGRPEGGAGTGSAGGAADGPAGTVGLGDRRRCGRDWLALRRPRSPREAGKVVVVIGYARTRERSAVPAIPLVLLVALMLVLAAPSGRPMAQAQEGDRIVTLGEDLTRAQEDEVLELLGASRQDRIIRVTSEETTRGSRGIIEIPPGTLAISSTAIVCREEGSGLDVRVENIEEVTAGMYAQSLLTAGITDAEVRVAAPEEAPAEGLTALTGIFKAYRQAPCVGGELDPARERLAQRELATTVELGEALGDREEASEVVLGTQEQVVARRLRDRAEIERVVDQQLERRGGGEVSDATRDRLVDLMVDLGSPDVDYGGYSRGWTLERQSRNRVRILARPPGQEGEEGETGNAGDTVQGTVRAISGGAITVATAGGGSERITAGDDVEVVRDGRQSTLGEIEETDRVTVERDADGRATRIIARSTGDDGAASGAGRVVTGTVAAAGADALRVRTGGDAENIRLADARGLDVTRNGREATIPDIRPGDRVTVTLDADDVPTRIVAQSTAPQGGDSDGGPNILPLLALLPLFLLMRSDDEDPSVRSGQVVRD